ncbi:MAG: GspH/FimT family pseudopilin [Acidobacteriota bacterium]
MMRRPTPPSASGRRRRAPVRPARRARAQRGLTLIELLAVLAIAGILSVLIIPRYELWVGGLQVRMAAQSVAHTLGEARLRAIRHHQNVAVKFREGADGRITLALYRDADGDGVLNRDIDDGVDPLIKSPRRLAYGSRRIRFGFPPGEAPTDPGQPRRRLTRLSDPIRFNRSDLASFSEIGTATPGTVYLTDDRFHLAAVRLSPDSSRVTILIYDRALELWRRLG